MPVKLKHYFKLVITDAQVLRNAALSLCRSCDMIRIFFEHRMRIDTFTTLFMPSKEKMEVEIIVRTLSPIQKTGTRMANGRQALKFCSQ